jgi:uric acid-xanthine permease
LNNPFSAKEKKPLVFYPKDAKIPVLLAMLMGLQHAFSMVGGLITPPYVIFKFSVDFLDVELQQYAISASLIASGICSIIQLSKLPIPFTENIFGRQLYVGSGVLSVMGTSFTFLPIYELAIQQQKDNGVDSRDAYGALLGTSMVANIMVLFLSLLPVAILHKIFPPIVTSVSTKLPCCLCM